MDYTNGRSEVFIDRKDELGFLRGVLDRKGFQLIPVWGRRRVGKTTLLRKALGEHAVNFIASDSQERDNLLQFRKTCAECLNDPTFNDLEPELYVMFRRLKEMKAVVLIDEFPYLVVGNSAIPSIF